MSRDRLAGARLKHAGSRLDHDELPNPFCPAFFSERGKIISAQDALHLIRKGDAIATGGLVGICSAEQIAVELEQLLLHSTDKDVLQWRAMSRAL